MHKRTIPPERDAFDRLRCNFGSVTVRMNLLANYTLLSNENNLRMYINRFHFSDANIMKRSSLDRRNWTIMAYWLIALARHELRSAWTSCAFYETSDVFSASFRDTRSGTIRDTVAVAQPRCPAGAIHEWKFFPHVLFHQRAGRSAPSSSFLE